MRSGMVMKLKRILALALLCVGLLVAGAPALACCAGGAPTHDCCSNRSPFGSRSYERVPHSGLQSCCAAGGQAAVAVASDVTPSETDVQPTRADPPLSITFLIALGASHSSARLGVASPTPFILPALSPLYLRTARLRL